MIESRPCGSHSAEPEENRAGRALLIRLGALGDTIHAVSAASLLRREFPEIEIDFLAGGQTVELFDLVADVDRVFALPCRNVPLWLHPAWRRIRKRLRETEYRLAFLMETDPRFLPLLEQVRARKRIVLASSGPHEGPGTDQACPNPLRYQQALWRAGVSPGVVCHPRLSTRAGHRQRARDLLMSLGLSGTRPLVGLHAGNSSRLRKRWRSWRQKGDLRSWPEDRWAELIRGIHGLNAEAEFVLFGSDRDRPANRRIAQAARAQQAGVLLADAAGRTDLPLAAALLETFALFVSTDTGPIHLAAALGVPLIGLYGPTRYEETRPFPENSAAAVLRKSLPCQPCYGTSRQKRCRVNRCMRSIEVEEVLAKVREVRADLFVG